MSTMRSERGFTLAEVLIVIALLGILASIVVLNFSGSDKSANERALQANLSGLRSAIMLYKADHGRYPCSTGDADYPCSDTQLKNKLTQFTDKSGNTSTSKNTTFQYGPYMDAFPVEPFSQADSLTWSLGTERLKETIADAIDSGTGDGGWFYEPQSGNILANLGSAFPNAYARF